MKEPSPHCFHTSPAPCCCFPVFQRVNGAHRGHQLCKPVYLVFGVCGGVNGLSPPCCAAALHKSSMLSRSVLQGLELNPFLLLCFPLAAVSVTSQHTGVQSQQLNTQEAWLRVQLDSADTSMEAFIFFRTKGPGVQLHLCRDAFI